MTLHQKGLLLVALQMLSLLVLILQSDVSAALQTLPSWRGILTLLLLIDAIGIAGLALWANRPGNFSVLPEPLPDSHLVTQGIYSIIRHPMYTAVILLGLGLWMAQPSVIGAAAWITLVLVLIEKSKAEETWLVQRYANYPDYMARTGRFFPRLR